MTTVESAYDVARTIWRESVPATMHDTSWWSGLDIPLLPNQLPAINGVRILQAVAMARDGSAWRIPAVCAVFHGLCRLLEQRPPTADDSRLVTISTDKLIEFSTDNAAAFEGTARELYAALRQSGAYEAQAARLQAKFMAVLNTCLA